MFSNPVFVSCSAYKADTDIRGRSFLLPHFSESIFLRNNLNSNNEFIVRGD